MIIIEGPDGAGKSTLAQALSISLGVKIFHSGGPAKTADEIFSRMNSLIEKLKNREIFIADRVPVISDVVYGPVLRGWTPFLEVDPKSGRSPLFRYRHDFLEVMRIPLIYCRPPAEVLISNAGRPQPEKETRTYAQPKSAGYVQSVKANSAELIRTYDREIAYYPHWTYDFTRTSSTLSLPRHVEELIKGHLP